MLDVRKENAMKNLILKTVKVYGKYNYGSDNNDYR
jgi:hypothetical protein